MPDVMSNLSVEEKSAWTRMWLKEELDEWYSPIYQELKDSIADRCILNGTTFVEKVSLLEYVTCVRVPNNNCDLCYVVVVA